MKQNSNRFYFIINNMTENKKRRSEWGKGWDGRSRIPDETFKKNYDEIDWSYVKKEDKDKKNDN